MASYATRSISDREVTTIGCSIMYLRWNLDGRSGRFDDAGKRLVVILVLRLDHNQSAALL